MKCVVMSCDKLCGDECVEMMCGDSLCGNEL